VVVRIRVDGALRILHELPKWVQGAITSRLKIMASLDIAEKRRPQDGRIKNKQGQKRDRDEGVNPSRGFRGKGGDKDL
jgi:type II secretory ATPase GspE/PulE/Tfp pilus assembly ATPase PilB-like protein